MAVKEYAIGHVVGERINIFYGERQEIRNFVLRLRNEDNDIFFTQVHIFSTEEKMRKKLMLFENEWEIKGIEFSPDMLIIK